MAMQGERSTVRESRRWWMLAVAVLAVLVDMVDNQIVAVALPTIQREIGAADTALQWITAGYALAFALTLITGARLGDRFGYGRLFIVGMIVFTVSSLGAGLALSGETLIVARVIQGAGSGLMVPQVLSLIHTSFSETERGKAMAFYTTAFPLGGVAGPILGGILTESNLFGFGWRAVFLVNVPIGVIAVIGALATMPPRAQVVRRSFGLGGMLLLTVALLSVLYPLVQGREAGWPWWTIVLMLAGIPLFALFTGAQHRAARRGTEPFIDPALLGTKSLLATQGMLFIVNAAVAAFFVLTLHLQQSLGFTPMQAALAFLPASVGIIAGNMSSFRLAPRHGGVLLVSALGVLMLSLAALSGLIVILGADLGAAALLLPMITFGFGMGAAMNTLFGAYFGRLEPAQAGSASGVLNATAQLGMATGFALFGTLYFSLRHDGSAAGAAWSLGAAAALVALALTLTPALRATRDGARSRGIEKESELDDQTGSHLP